MHFVLPDHFISQELELVCMHLVSPAHFISQELELVYMLRGTLLISLKQPSEKHSRVVYR